MVKGVWVQPFHCIAFVIQPFFHDFYDFKDFIRYEVMIVLIAYLLCYVIGVELGWVNRGELAVIIIKATPINLCRYWYM